VPRPSVPPLARRAPVVTEVHGQRRVDDYQWLRNKGSRAVNAYLRAENAYTAAIQKFPRSMWVPEAYYKRGKAQESLGTPEAARASYEMLLKTYPDTPSAGLAKQALDRLGRQAAAPRP